jgi:hypothetical protein
MPVGSVVASAAGVGTTDAAEVGVALAEGVGELLLLPQLATAIAAASTPSGASNEKVRRMRDKRFSLRTITP